MCKCVFHDRLCLFDIIRMFDAVYTCIFSHVCLTECMHVYDPAFACLIVCMSDRAYLTVCVL